MTELRALAEKATPGPWRQQRGWPMGIVTVEDEGKARGGASDPREDAARFAHPIAEVQLDDITLRDAPWVAEEFPHRRVHPEQSRADAAYIAAANPTAILSLLDTLDSLTAERDELREKVAALEVDLREAVEQWGLYADAESRRAALSEGGSK